MAVRDTTSSPGGFRALQHGADAAPTPAQPVVSDVLLRFVVLHHTGVPMPHFDLMFETGPGGPLATWRSADWPVNSPAVVERLADHRRKYLDYEGPVSGDRGRVSRVIEGRFRFEAACEGLVVVATEQEHRFTFRREGDTALWRMEVGQSR